MCRRRRMLSNLCFVLLLFAYPGLCSGDAIKQEMSAAVASVTPALVRIHMVSTDYRQGREIRMESYGSGVIISGDGYAVTNHHVAMDAERIVCTMADRRELQAKLIGTDALSDIAVIKVESPDGEVFPFASFGDSSSLEVGDRVFAMGCPYALSQSVTVGMVSNTEMVMPDYMSSHGFVLDGEDVGSIVRWIGHDALIRPGSSGGPLVNAAGEIVGINEISFGLSGAIPSNLAKEVARQLISKGEVKRSWIGLEVQPLLKSSGLDKGILVSGTIKDSPARSAGFEAGDVLISMDGVDVVARFREQIPLFNQFVADLPIGNEVEAKVQRSGSVVPVKFTTEERRKATEKEHELRMWGMCASNITYLAKLEMGLDSQDGVKVSSVLPSGPAGSARPSLTWDDIIVEVDNRPVKDVEELRQVTKELVSDEGPVPVLVDFMRDKEHYATVVDVGKKEQSRSGTEITKAWLPVDMQVLTRELAQAMGVPDRTGVRITRVHNEAVSGELDLKIGDLIVSLDGEDIPASQIGDEQVLPSLIRQYDIEAEVELGIIRKGEERTVTVKLAAAPRPTRDYPKYEDDNFQFTARDIAFSDRSSGDVEPDAAGALVVSVSEGSWAALGGLRANDVIVSVDGEVINNLSSLESKMSEIETARPKMVVFHVERGIHGAFVECEPEWQD